MYKYLLEKGIKIVYKKVDYLSLDRLIKINFYVNIDGLFKIIRWIYEKLC